MIGTYLGIDFFKCPIRRVCRKAWFSEFYVSCTFILSPKLYIFMYFVKIDKARLDISSPLPLFTLHITYWETHVNVNKVSITLHLRRYCKVKIRCQMATMLDNISILLSPETTLILRQKYCYNELLITFIIIFFNCLLCPGLLCIE